jgi:hypothetical protein
VIAESNIGFGQGYCRSCGRRITSQERFCIYCGKPNTILDEEETPSKGAGMSRLGGALVVLSAILSLAGLWLIVGAVNSIQSSSYNDSGAVDTYKSIVSFVAVILGILAVFAIVGGLSALNGVSYSMAFFGAIASVLGPAGAIGLAGLVLITTSESDFKPANIEVGGLGPQGPHATYSDGSVERIPAEELKKSPYMRR